MPIVVDGIKLERPSGNHRIGMQVPQGGSSCSTCRFVRGPSQCAQYAWVMAPREHGGGGGKTKLPMPADEWCCDYWEG